MPVYTRFKCLLPVLSCQKLKNRFLHSLQDFGGRPFTCSGSSAALKDPLPKCRRRPRVSEGPTAEVLLVSLITGQHGEKEEQQSPQSLLIHLVDRGTGQRPSPPVEPTVQVNSSSISPSTFITWMVPVVAWNGVDYHDFNWGKF
ncbi:hypothetical protein UY3_01937 [Chelonia mydas]|uniref:Uncharacterized protein n=1 Tax=Chelonia mydas TaxID=8469 RepID=M7BSI5_CHEMY|nr:hypothetical protein UY3_01937 [Chelonia mydas]